MLKTLTEILIILDITKTESNDCFIIHYFEKKKGQTQHRVEHLTLVLEITFMLCARKLQISH